MHFLSFYKRSAFPGFVIIFFIFLLSGGCGIFKSGKITTLPTADTLSISFYNVENLFDTLDDPAIADEDFTPEGKLKWNTDRYRKKLENLSRVVEAMSYPSILGLAEIENRSVLEDWINYGSMKMQNYAIVHFDSPDERGIDVAMIYKKSDFRVSDSRIIPVNLPDVEDMVDNKTRDVLVVNGFLKNKPVVLFFNHWPSRGGGQQKTEPLRKHVAQIVRTEIEPLLANGSRVVIIGDFNDEPDNNSVAQVLKAGKIETPVSKNELYNCFYESHQKGEGTYNFRGNWNQLDQLIVSGNLLSADSDCSVVKAEVFKKDWMLYDDKKYGPLPNRTYGGPNYYGGYSDHLPILARLVLR